MEPLEERLNDRVGLLISEKAPGEQHVSGFTMSEGAFEDDPTLNALVDQARRLRQASQLQVAPGFAKQLERRVLRRSVELRSQHKSRWRFPWAFLFARPVLGVTFGICLLIGLLSSSLLALAAQVSDPANPIYAITRWEQHFQVSLTNNPADQVALHVRFAREQLNALASLIDTSHAGLYRQTLTEMDQQIDAATSGLSRLSDGTQRSQLLDELTRLKREAIHILRSLLPHMALAERLVTTDELAHLGDAVPHLAHATFRLSAAPHGKATISLSGAGIEAGAQLLVDGKEVPATGTLQNGQLIFVIDWNGSRHPHSLGILNTDGTAAQITAVTLQDSDPQGAQGNNQNGNGHKPSGTPTPQDKKSDAIPTPQGKKPDATPTPHH